MTDGIADLEREIKDHRTKKGAASEQLHALSKLAPVSSARDELKKLRDELRQIIQRQQREIDQRRKEIARIREHRHDANGAALAVRWAHDRLGVTELPPGSNWGHPVEDWILWMGYGGPEPWCGCFAGYAVAKIGGAKIPSPIRLGYAPNIGTDARAGVNGLHAVAVADAKPGDVFQYGAVHVGLCVGLTRNGQVEAIEGNTSPGTEGSQYNGGCVAHKYRPTSFVTCVARPAY